MWISGTTAGTMTDDHKNCKIKSNPYKMKGFINFLKIAFHMKLCTKTKNNS